MKPALLAASMFAFVLASSLLIAPAPASLPETATEPVTDVYHGVEVVDPYRWLETWSDSKVQEWSDAQNAHAREYLDGLPSVDAIRSRITEIMESAASSYRSLTWREGRLFAVKRQPPKQQRFLVVMPSADEPGAERVLVDPNEIDPTGATTIDWYRPSPDGDLVAVSLSAAGTESGDVHLYRTETGEELEETIPRVNGGTAGGDLAWNPDGSGFYYTRYPHDGERPQEDMNFYQQIYHHTLGTRTEEDTYEFGDGFPRIAEIRLDIDRRSGRLLATMQYGDGGRFQLYTRDPEGEWRQLTDYDDEVVQGTIGPDGNLYMISRQDAPRGKILRMSPDDPSLQHAETIVPEGDDTIISNFYYSSTMATAGSRLYLSYQLGGPSEIRAFDLDGNPVTAPEQLPVSSVRSLTPVGNGAILFSNTSYIDPQAWFRYDPVSGTTRKTALVTESPVDFADSEVVREFAVSKDGTRVPVNIIRPRGIVLDGSHPVMLTGYGGYGINTEPGFSAVRRVLVEQGCVFAEANIRGGAEFGEEWHRQGMLTNKQNVFDDFAAVMQHMIDAGYTTSEKLAIVGGSNGGLLMGAMLTQHPEIPRAVISFVGIYDMLRVELSPNGAFNIPEFGTVKDPEQFRALHAYSPYHQVKDGTAYPATLFMTGANDPRVDPMQSRKMTARLQAASSSGEPILLRTSSDTGHGGGTPLRARIEEMTDAYSFMFERLGVQYKPVRAD